MGQRLSKIDVATALVLLLATAMLLRPTSPLVSGVREKYDHWTQDRAVAKNWDSLVAISMPLYDGGGTPDLLEFSDYQCPFCRAVSPSVDSALAAGLKVSIVHLPLPNHSNAKAAAETAICLGHAGVFTATHRNLYERIAWFSDTTKADSIRGLFPTRQSSDCMAAKVLQTHIDLATRLRIDATPTFVSKTGVVRTRLSAATLLSYGAAR